MIYEKNPCKKDIMRVLSFAEKETQYVSKETKRNSLSPFFIYNGFVFGESYETHGSMKGD